MAIQTSYNFFIVINGTTLSDHCNTLRINMPQTANEASAAGDTHREYRAGVGDPSIEATFRADDAVSNVNQTLRNMISPTSTGVSVTARRLNSARNTANPEYTAEMVVSGDLMAMDDSWGEVPQINVRLVPVGAFTLVTASTT